MGSSRKVSSEAQVESKSCRPFEEQQNMCRLASESSHTPQSGDFHRILAYWNIAIDNFVCFPDQMCNDYGKLCIQITMRGLEIF